MNGGHCFEEQFHGLMMDVVSADKWSDGECTRLQGSRLVRMGATGEPFAAAPAATGEPFGCGGLPSGEEAQIGVLRYSPGLVLIRYRAHRAHAARQPATRGSAVAT